MASIVELFPKCRKLAYDARQQLSQVQNGVLHPSELLLSLDELSRQLDTMEQLVLRETPAQREVWKRKIQELREECNGTRRRTEHYDRTVNINVRHQKERDELLTRRRQRKEYSSTDEQDLTNLADESKSWQQSQQMVSGLLENGAATLSHLEQQRQGLQGVSRFLSQIGDSMSISNATMRVIERLDVTDAYFVLAGIVITCINFYVVWFWF